ncbi:hypothetical protein B7Z28_01250 [Candidatus Saccharibacteria bacterium 32-45-3]|nr:MAG: hypothetical protein B7Z28_01250 [Candidatus Saccharibacteria bacterium 32-45-3]
MIYPTPIWYHRLRQVALKVFWNRDIFIHELQLEPWGPVDTKHLSVEEQNKSMSTEQVGKSLSFARMIGNDHIYTWGGEWWYWRKVHGDPTIWDTVKQEFNEQEQKALYF